MVERGKHWRVAGDLLGDLDRARELGVAQVANGRAADNGVPARADRGVQANTHKAMVETNGPGVPICQGGKDLAGEL